MLELTGHKKSRYDFEQRGSALIILHFPETTPESPKSDFKVSSSKSLHGIEQESDTEKVWLRYRV